MSKEGEEERPIQWRKGMDEMGQSSWLKSYCAVHNWIMN